MFFTNIFDAKVIHTESITNRAPGVRPETRVDFALVVAVGLEAFFKELLCYYSGLW